jgi:hypothetical protein
MFSEDRRDSSSASGRPGESENLRELLRGSLEAFNSRVQARLDVLPRGVRASTRDLHSSAHRLLAGLSRLLSYSPARSGRRVGFLAGVIGPGSLSVVVVVMIVAVSWHANLFVGA